MLTDTEKTKMDIIITAFLLAYMPKQLIFDTAAEMLSNLVPLE